MNIFEKIIASLVAIPKAIWNGLVQPIIDGVAWILNKIWPDMGDGLIDGIKSIGGTLLAGLTWPFRKAREFVSGLFSGEGSGIISSILGGLGSIVLSSFSLLTWPFRKMLEFVSGLFSGEGSGIISSILGGLGSIVSSAFSLLTWPFRKMLEFVSGLFSGEGSGILGSMLDGLKSVGSSIANALISAFKSVINFVSGIFGGDGSLGSMIIDSIKNISGKLLDELTGTFRKAYELIKKIPFVGKLFGGGDATATVNAEAKTNVEKQISTAVEVKNINELKETINKLIEAISKLGGTAGGASPVVNVNNNQNAMIEKLDELIGLLKDGAIAVNMDGILVSRTLAKTS
jgi:hypothetical protein